MALDEYDNCLSDEEKKEFRSTEMPNPKAALNLTTLIDSRSHDLHRSQCMGTRLTTFLESARQFSDTLDTITSSHPEVAALVWGGIKLTLLVANNVTTYFEKLSRLFMKLGRTCPRFEDYGKLYSESIKVQTALCDYYAVVIRLCRFSVESSRQSSSKRHWGAIFAPFEVDFGPYERELSSLSDSFMDEVSLESHRVNASSFQLQKDIQQEQKKQGGIITEILSQFTGSDLEKRLHVAKLQILEDQKMKLLKIFSNNKYHSTWDQLRKECTPGTSTWIFETDSFRSWMAGSLKLIWCCGRLGSGKSIISACAVSYVVEASSPEDRASFFFCRYDDEQSLKARSIIGALARQFAGDIPSSEFADLEEDHIDSLTMVSFLIRKLSRQRQYFIILDGLDECEEIEVAEVIHMLSKLMASPLRISIYCSTRPAILERLPSDFRPEKSINLEDPQTQAKLARDMNCFVERNLEVQDQEMESVILRMLREGAEGMFLWVKLQLGTLRKAKSNTSLLAALRTLPPSLSDTYERSLKQIVGKDDTNLAVRVFTWVAAAKRPLSVDELREAIAIKLLGKAQDYDELVHDMTGALSCCGNLIFVNEEYHTVHFTHSSVKEYLKSQDVHESLVNYQISLPDADYTAGVACVTYLTTPFGAVAKQNQSSKLMVEVPGHVQRTSSPFGKVAHRVITHQVEKRIRSGEQADRIFREMAGDTEKKRQEKEYEKDAFRPYAERFWLEHTKRRIDSKSSMRLWGLWCDLVERFEWADKYSVTWDSHDWGLRADSVLKWIVEQDQCSLAQFVATSRPALSDDQLIILLNGAAARGRQDMVDIYLDLSRAPQYLLDSGLFEACKSGQSTLVDHLLVAQADVDAKSSKMLTPLRAAAAGGFTDIVVRLLKENPEIDPSDYIEPRRTPLQAAAEAGHLEIVMILHENGADINAPAGERTGRTALQAAAGGGHGSVVASLLRWGAEGNAPAGRYNGRTALQAAAENGDMEIIHRLLHGPSLNGIEKANVNAPASFDRGLLALQAAAGNGYEDAVSYLIAAGADVNAIGCVNGGRTALQAAAENGHLSVVNILLAAREKADVNAPGEFQNGRTALQAAAGSGHIHIVNRLLKVGADCNASPAHVSGRTALQAAAEGGHMKVVSNLLRAGAAVNAPPCGEDGLTAIQAAAIYGELDLIHLLLSKENRADPNAPAADKFGHTALQAAAARGHVKAIDRFLQEGVDVNAPACRVSGRTALQAAAGGGFLTAVERLLQEGADSNAESGIYNGRTAIQAAAGGGHDSIVRTLLGAGAAVNTPLKDLGITALRAAAEGGFLSTVRILLVARATDEAEVGGEAMGMTARYAAQINRHPKVEACLLEAGFSRVTIGK